MVSSEVLGVLRSLSFLLLLRYPWHFWFPYLCVLSFDPLYLRDGSNDLLYQFKKKVILC